jgi:hypothetical protein
MPQAQALAGCMSQRCGRPCRMCNITYSDDLGDMNFDEQACIRTKWEIQDYRTKFETDNTALEDTGLNKESSALSDPGLSFDETTGIPPEPLHSELAGISKLIVSTLLGSLTGKWINNLGLLLARMKTPWKYKLPDPALSQQGNVKMNAEQVCKFVSILPFLLSSPDTQGDGRPREWLRVTMFTEAARQEFTSRLGEGFCACIRKAIQSLAESNALVFTEERLNDSSSLLKLEKTIRDTRRVLTKVFGTQLLARPNTHTGVHLPYAADLFAVLKNCDVRTYETKHAPFKRIIAHTNKKGVEVQMMIFSNTKQALRFLAAGGEPRSESVITDELRQFVRGDVCMAQLLEDASMSSAHSERLQANKLSETGSLQLRNPTGSVTLSLVERAINPTLMQTAITYKGVKFPRSRLMYSRDEINVGEYWEVDLASSSYSEAIVAPVGPRSGFAIALVNSILVNAVIDVPTVWVRVSWLAKTSNVPQELTGCHTYELRSASRFSPLISVHNLARPVHIVEQGLKCLLNPYFIK